MEKWNMEAKAHLVMSILACIVFGYMYNIVFDWFTLSLLMLAILWLVISAYSIFNNE